MAQALSTAGTPAELRISVGNGSVRAAADRAEEAAKPHDEPLRLCGWSLQRLGAPVQLLLCAGAVFACYMVYGYVQERIFRIPCVRPLGWFLTLVQFGVYVGIAGIELWAAGPDARVRHIPLNTYIGLSLLTVATMGLSNASLGYLNYPTQVVFKSCKLIPVMLGGMLIQQKPFSAVEFAASVVMCFGLVMYTLADVHMQPHFDHTGVLFISLALCADAAIGNVQEKAMRTHRASNTEVVFYSYGLGFLAIFLYELPTLELFDGLACFAQQPLESYSLAVLFSVTGYLGIHVVLTLVRRFGALVAVTGRWQADGRAPVCAKRRH